jgi:hypothetical protein
MSHVIEHVFAVIGCITVSALALGGFLVAIGVVRIDKAAISIEKDKSDDEP